MVIHYLKGFSIVSPRLVINLQKNSLILRNRINIHHDLFLLVLLHDIGDQLIIIIGDNWIPK